MRIGVSACLFGLALAGSSFAALVAPSEPCRPRPVPHLSSDGSDDTAQLPTTHNTAPVSASGKRALDTTDVFSPPKKRALDREVFDTKRKLDSDVFDAPRVAAADPSRRAIDIDVFDRPSKTAGSHRKLDTDIFDRRAIDTDVFDEHSPVSTQPRRPIDSDVFR